MRRPHARVLGGLTVALVAATAHAQPAMLARADSAFAAEDRALARHLYEQVLRVNPQQSRAVFRLAQLEHAPARALTLYQRYAELEPRDPWGHIALGDQLARIGNVPAAMAAYDRAAALAPSERDVVIGRARILSRAGRSDVARATLALWTSAHADDGEAWDLLGREQLRAGRPRAALRSFERARSAGNVGVDARLRRARADAAPSVEPFAGYQRDSDGHSTARSGMSLDAMVADGARAGAMVERGAVLDAAESIAYSDGAMRLAAHLAPTARLDLRAGIRSFEGTGSRTSWAEPQGEARLRLRASPNGVTLDLRVQHVPLGTAPILVDNRVTRSDARATLELPLGPLRLRGTARAGALRALQEAANRRLDAGGALVVPLGSSGEVSARYHALTFAHASSGGYFAPRVAQTVEAGTYLELGADARVTLSADVGAGAQRVARQGEAVGVWKPAFRLWAYTSASLAPGRALWVEMEAYDAPFAPVGVATAPSWRFVALSTGLRWSLR
jgi:Flp pilus assembly protein TadD